MMKIIYLHGNGAEIYLYWSLEFFASIHSFKWDKLARCVVPPKEVKVLGIRSCGYKIKHNHILCFNCEEYIGICFNCKVYKKKTVTALHHFYKICGIKNCTEKGSHEHYLCKSCKKNAVYEEKGIIH